MRKFVYKAQYARPEARRISDGVIMRIDHVYVTPPLAARAVAAVRDRDARKPSTYPGIPSDHAPLIVDFADR